MVAERLRSAVADHVFPIGGGIRLTASFGVALSPDHAQNRSDLVDVADKAMYVAKKLGRNQVRSASDSALNLTTLEKSGSRDDLSLFGTVEALASLVDARDQYTGEHTQEVCALVSRLATVLDLAGEEVHMLSIAARLHDIGKVAIPDAILNKPDKLDPEEWRTMQGHAAIGGDIVAHVPSLRPLAPIVRAHHERWDGTGYPDQLAGDQIPLGARIIAVADSYGAMTTNRTYRQASSPDWAFAELLRCAGSQFDPRVVEAFVQLLTKKTV
jgi:HD-GYP domain-containing protein (c-di-GMP phosphodiesterase class II)